MIELRLQAKASGPYLTDLRCRTGTFTKAFPVHPASVTTADCQRYLDGLQGASSTKNATRQVLWHLFAHCESRGYIPRGANPFADTERFNGQRENAIEVWTPAEMAKLLACGTRDFLSCLAIGGFAGLGTSEILALGWEDVRLSERTIKVTHRKARGAGTPAGTDHREPGQMAVAAGQGERSGLANRSDVARAGAKHRRRTKRDCRGRRTASVAAQLLASLVLCFSRRRHQKRPADGPGSRELCGNHLQALPSLGDGGRRQGLVRRRAAPLGLKRGAPAAGDRGLNGPLRSRDGPSACPAWFASV